MKDLLDVFFDACESAIEYSASSGYRYFVYRASETSFSGTPELREKWLFRAYPGGRKQLSLEGKNFLKEQGVDVKKATRLK